MGYALIFCIALVRGGDCQTHDFPTKETCLQAWHAISSENARGACIPVGHIVRDRGEKAVCLGRFCATK